MAALAAVIDRCDFGKRQLLVRAGAALGYAYFIEKGMTRSYWIVDGEEITTSFSIEGAIVFSMDELCGLKSTGSRQDMKRCPTDGPGDIPEEIVQQKRHSVHAPAE